MGTNTPNSRSQGGHYLPKDEYDWKQGASTPHPDPCPYSISYQKTDAIFGRAPSCKKNPVRPSLNTIQNIICLLPSRSNLHPSGAGGLPIVYYSKECRSNPPNLGWGGKDVLNMLNFLLTRLSPFPSSPSR